MTDTALDQAGTFAEETGALLDQQLLARITRLDIATRKLLQGRQKGEKRSKKRGRSVEFAEGSVVNADFMVIDFNPVLHEKLAARGVKCLYGDISHADVLEHAGVDKAKVLVCSISDDFLRGINNRGLLEILRRMNPHATIIVTAPVTETSRTAGTIP